MKSFLTGLGAILVIGLLIIAVRNRNLIPNTDPTPTPSGIPSNWDMTPETSADPTPTPSTVPTTDQATTKGGLPITDNKILGATTTTKTTTTTKKVTSITILESSDCLLDATTYLRDITYPLTIKYALIDDYSATITIWKTNGESVLNQTLISGSGVLTTIDTRDDLKFQIVSQDCKEITDTWLRITAEK